MPLEVELLRRIFHEGRVFLETFKWLKLHEAVSVIAQAGRFFGKDAPQIRISKNRLPWNDLIVQGSNAARRRVGQEVVEKAGANKIRPAVTA